MTERAQPQRMSSRQRYLLLGLSPLTLLFLLWLSQSWANPFDKDFRQGYVLALALRHGADPYQPLPALTERWLSLPQPEPFQHPTPHPFAVGWLCLPLTLLSYPRAAVAWFVFECGCLVVALLLWLRVIGRPVRWRFVGTGLFALFAWHPLVVELWFGQLAVLLTVVFLLTWLALREGRELTGGALLGSLAVLKLMGGPVLLWLVARSGRGGGCLVGGARLGGGRARLGAGAHLLFHCRAASQRSL
jgi:hypothetical protein